MASNVDWDIEKYREEHESEEHWLLKRAFMTRWKENYTEDRLVCLAKVFYNIEFMGCKYPKEVMEEVAALAKEVPLHETYRNAKKTKLQRTFVSASDAAEDRAKGVKREGGVIKEAPPIKKLNLESFVKEGEGPQDDTNSDDDALKTTDEQKEEEENISSNEVSSSTPSPKYIDYLDEMRKMKCAEISMFTEHMFHTQFGRLVLLIRPWLSKLTNLQVSCMACKIPFKMSYENRRYSITVNGQLVAETHSDVKLIARSAAESMAWEAIKKRVLSVVIKEQFIPQGDAPISVGDVSGTKSADTFGSPIDSKIASKMMQMMGWAGGGLGVDSQGIKEPVQPELRMVKRSGLGSTSTDIRQLRRAAHEMLRRFITSSSLDVDLVFSSDFSKEERAALHQCAQRVGLASKSYGADKDRFLVIKKKLNPFSITSQVVREGGTTAKYAVFIPAALCYYTPPPCVRRSEGLE